MSDALGEHADPDGVGAASARRRAHRRWWRRPPSKGRRVGTAVALSAAVAPLAGASPVGTSGLDIAWAMGLAALASYLGSTAKRGPLLIAATVAVGASRSLFAVFLGIAGVALGALSTRNLRRRAFFARGTSAGATTVSLLASAPELRWWWTVLAVAGIVLPIVVSGFRNMERALRRRVAFLAVAASAYLVGASGLAAIGALSGAGDVDRGTTALEIGLAAARQGDVATASAQLEAARLALADAHEAVERWGFFGQIVPLTAQHVDVLEGLLADAEVAAGQASRTAVVAEANDLGVETGRVDVDAVVALQNPLRRLSDNLGALVDEVRDGGDEPLLPIVRDRLDRIEPTVTKAWREAFSAAEAARAVPGLLGADEPQRYLVLFTSPAEARGRFGFPGSFAEVTFRDGRLVLGEHGTTSAVFARLRADQAPFDTRDDRLAPYVAYGPTQTFLSATIPPDLRTVAGLAAELWRQSGREPVDGVLRFDPASLAPLLAFTGPISVPGVAEPLTAANLEQYLVFDQYVQFANENAPRREVLETVSEEVLRRLQSSDLPEPRVLVDLFKPLLDGGHLGAVAFDDAGGGFLELVGLTSDFRPPPSDGLAVANVNISGNKIDTFLTRTVRYDARVADGRLSGTLAVELRNAAPAQDLPTYVIGSATDPPLPLGTNRTTLQVFTAVPATEILLDGRPVRARSERSGGRFVHQIVVELPPGGAATVELRLGGPLPDAEYSLVLEPGGGAVPDEYSVAVDVEGRDPLTFRGRVATMAQVG